MDRLIAEVDRLIESGAIAERVIIQSAAFGRQPRHAEVVGIVASDRVKELMREATCVICHGGPASILEALAAGKRPVVVPRDPRAGEQVDDHQLRFVRWIAARRPITPVWDVSTLQDALDTNLVVASDASAPTATVLRLVELVESEGPRRRPRR